MNPLNWFKFFYFELDFLFWKWKIMKKAEMKQIRWMVKHHHLFFSLKSTNSVAIKEKLVIAVGTFLIWFFEFVISKQSWNMIVRFRSRLFGYQKNRLPSYFIFDICRLSFCAPLDQFFATYNIFRLLKIIFNFVFV